MSQIPSVFLYLSVDIVLFCLLVSLRLNFFEQGGPFLPFCLRCLRFSLSSADEVLPRGSVKFLHFSFPVCIFYCDSNSTFTS